jgi:hypothetical protein
LLFADAILAEDAPVFAVFEDWVAMLPTPKDLECGVGAGFGKSVKVEKPMAPYFIGWWPTLRSLKGGIPRACLDCLPARVCRLR